MTDPRTLLRRLFDAAVAAADPMVAVPKHLPEPPRGRVVVIGAGKATARMAEALEQSWDGPLSGFVITRYGYERPCERIEIHQSAHPVPDEAGRVGAARMLEMVSGLTEDDLVIALISGGGSALMPLPADGITLEEKQEVNRALLACGATIGEMNVVRKHLSAIKGGRLAAACFPAKLVSLMISDVPGDDPAVIASGPTVGEASTPADARAIVDRYGIALPESCARHLDRAEGCPAPGDVRLVRARNIIISAPQISLEAAARTAREAGVIPLILGDSIEGEAREAGTVMAGIAAQVLNHGQPLPRPCVLLSGGETTVTLRGDGRGGRNVEFLLSAAIKLGGKPVWALAGDTDGVDGAEEIAGAIAAPDTLARAREMGLDPHAELARNNAHGFFEAVGDQVVTGPTLTNVNDFRAILIP
ncbi:MAG: glycerate kinase [Pseudomonadota bacterium]